MLLMKNDDDDNWLWWSWWCIWHVRFVKSRMFWEVDSSLSWSPSSSSSSSSLSHQFRRHLSLTLLAGIILAWRQQGKRARARASRLVKRMSLDDFPCALTTLIYLQPLSQGEGSEPLCPRLSGTSLTVLEGGRAVNLERANLDFQICPLQKHHLPPSQNCRGRPWPSWGQGCWPLPLGRSLASKWRIYSFLSFRFPRGTRLADNNLASVIQRRYLIHQQTWSDPFTPSTPKIHRNMQWFVKFESGGHCHCHHHHHHHHHHHCHHHCHQHHHQWFNITVIIIIIIIIILYAGMLFIIHQV